jgi:hypothetical protein
MAWKANHTQADIHAALQAKLIAWEKAILNTLFYLGERCVNQARTLNTYRDQTGNLRNSVGYVVLKYGTVVRSNFRQTAQVVTVRAKKFRSTKGGSSGVQAAKALAEELASNYSTGYVLIVVAGMNYAVKVESSGKDVLTSAEQLAQTELPKLLKQLKLDAQAL